MWEKNLIYNFGDIAHEVKMQEICNPFHMQRCFQVLIAPAAKVDITSNFHQVGKSNSKAQFI